MKTLLKTTLKLTALATGLFVTHAVLVGLFLGAPLATGFVVGMAGVLGVDVLKSK